MQINMHEYGGYDGGARAKQTDDRMASKRHGQLGPQGEIVLEQQPAPPPGYVTVHLTQPGAAAPTLAFVLAAEIPNLKAQGYRIQLADTDPAPAPVHTDGYSAGRAKRQFSDISEDGTAPLDPSQQKRGRSSQEQMQVVMDMGRSRAMHYQPSQDYVMHPAAPGGYPGNHGPPPPGSRYALVSDRPGAEPRLMLVSDGAPPPAAHAPRPVASAPQSYAPMPASNQPPPQPEGGQAPRPGQLMMATLSDGRQVLVEPTGLKAGGPAPAPAAIPAPIPRMAPAPTAVPYGAPPPHAPPPVHAAVVAELLLTSDGKLMLQPKPENPMGMPPLANQIAHTPQGVMRLVPLAPQPGGEPPRAGPAPVHRQSSMDAPAMAAAGAAPAPTPAPAAAAPAPHAEANGGRALQLMVLPDGRTVWVEKMGGNAPAPTGHPPAPAQAPAPIVHAAAAGQPAAMRVPGQPEPSPARPHLQPLGQAAAHDATHAAASAPKPGAPAAAGTHAPPQQQPPQQQPAAAQPGAGGGASKVNNMAAALVARMSAGGQSLAGQRALRSVMVRHLCSMQLDLLSYHLPNLDRPPLFGKRPQYIKPQPTNTVTAQWLSRIFVEHGSQRLHLFTAAGELPPAFAKAISNELVVSEFILRKTIPIDHIEGKPMVMWPVKETTLIQGHGLVQLSDARVGAVVHLDDGRQMVISPQKVEEFLVIVGVMLEAGVRCSAPANEQEAARVKEVAESVVKTVAREVPADHELASALAIMRAEETGAAVAASGAGAAPGGSNGAAGGRVVSPNHQTVAVHMVSATGAPPAAAPVAAVAPGPSPARGAVAAMDQVQAGGALAGNGPALAAAAAAARTAPAPEQQSAPAGGAGADAGAPGAAPVGDAGQQGGEGGAAAEAAAAADPAGAAAVDAPPSPSTPTVLKPEDGA